MPDITHQAAFLTVRKAAVLSGLFRKCLAVACLALMIVAAGPCPPAGAQSQADQAAARPAGPEGLLNDQERQWLREHPVIRVVQDPGWPPIEFADPDGNPVGISNDYLNLLEQRLGIRFERVRNLSWQEAYSRLQRWDIDLTTSVTVTPERLKFWAFTNPYMNIPIVILAHSDVTYVGNMHQLEGKKVAVVDGYAVCDWIPRDFPGVELVKVKTTKAGIDLLQAREVFAFVDNMLVIGYYLAQLKMINLKIAGETPYLNAQSMAVRKDWAPLAGIIQKGLDSITAEQKRTIYNKWVPIRYDHGFDYSLLWQALGVFFLILLVLIYWNRKMSREIKLRKAIEADLRASQQRFRQLFNVTPVALCIVDSSGVMRDMNDRFVHTFGWTRQDVPDLNEWWRRAYPDPEYRRGIQEEWERRMRRSLREKVDSAPLESRVAAGDGRELTVIASGSVLEDLTLYVFYDLTERKRVEEALRESEEKFSLIFKRAPLMAAISDLENSALLEVNDKLLATFGAGREEALGRNVVELGWMRVEDRDRIVQTLQSGEKVAGLEVTCRANDGRAVHCLFHCELVSIANAKRVLTLALDVTEHKRAEGDKAELEAQLRQAQKMEAVGTLAGGIAHDFNNILSTVFGFAEMAMESAKTGRDNTPDLRQILSAGERAKELVRQILTFSRKVEVELKPLDLNKEVQRVAALLERTIPKMISIETRLEPGLGPVRANANQMEQILLNLATNAQDAMPDGGRLSIETRRVDLDQAYSLQHLEVRPGRYVLLQVSDTGKGVDEAAREHIFEPFYTTKDVGKGTGLGLSTVYGIVKGHQGEIYCYSEPGYGTTFKIYLPVVEDAPQAAAETAELPLSALQGAERILLVDDEEALRELGARTLSMAGYRVATAASGEEALEAFQADDGGFDLVVLDLGMPGMGGHKTLQAILEMRPEAKVIIASGYSAEGPVKATLASGAAGYVAKPFGRRDLLSTVRAVLDGE